jgi:predicted nuclease of predicted toxin-antitoxin system
VILRDFRLLTDENIAAEVVEFLRTEGFKVLDVKEAGLIGSTDEELLQRSVREQSVVITHDPDFGLLAVAAGEPFVGLLYLRPGHITARRTIESIEAVLRRNFELQPPFIIVAQRTGDQIRIRLRQ